MKAQLNRMVMVAGLILFVVAPLARLRAQTRVTEHTWMLAPGAASPAARIGDVAWIAGHWVGPALGGEAEEIWSPPKAGTMMGMFRLMRKESVAFYELLTIAEADSSVILRLKHFNPDLTGWEERHRTIDFRLVRVTPDVVEFEGLTFRRNGTTELTVFLLVTGKDSSRQEMAFPYTRAGGS